MGFLTFSIFGLWENRPMHEEYIFDELKMDIMCFVYAVKSPFFGCCCSWYFYCLLFFFVLNKQQNPTDIKELLWLVTEFLFDRFNRLSDLFECSHSTATSNKAKVTEQQLEIDHTTIKGVSSEKNPMSIRQTNFRLLCQILWILQNANKTKREREKMKRTAFLNLMLNACFIILNILFYSCFDSHSKVFNEIIHRFTTHSSYNFLFSVSLFLYGIVNTPKFQWIFLGVAS